MSMATMGRTARLRLSLFAAILAAAAQVVIAAAPIGEALSGADARSHVEVAGTRLHHAHDEATCAACISQHLLAASELGRPSHGFVIVSASRPAAAVVRDDSRSRNIFVRSRAPPSLPV